MKIKDIMTPNPIYVSPHDSVANAVKLMLNQRLRHLLVVENTVIVGVISETDVPVNVKPQLEVKNIMSPNPISMDLETGIEDAIRVMQNFKIGCLPVTQNNQIVGVLTNFDLNTKLLASNGTNQFPQLSRG